MAAQRLERGAGSVRLDLVIARGDPDLAFMFDANLRRAEDVAGRMQGNSDAVDLDGLGIGGAAHVDLAEAAAQDGYAVVVAEIGLRAETRVVAVAVGDDGAGDGAPGVDVEIARRAVEALGPGDDEAHVLLAKHAAVA